MNGSNLFLDTNVILYFFQGDELLLDIFSEKTLYISFVTELELLGMNGLSEADKTKIKSFLKRTIVVNVPQAIKQKVIELRSVYKIKLPDCIIAASAIHYNMPLITADKGFKKIEPLELLLYQR